MDGQTRHKLGRQTGCGGKMKMADGNSVDVRRRRNSRRRRRMG